MTVLDDPRTSEPLEEYPHAINVGPIGRLGRYTATHFRTVLVGWLIVAFGLGFFAPRVETALSGAGWETTGSQSVLARNLIDQHFHGLSSYALMTVVSSKTQTVGVAKWIFQDGDLHSLLGFQSHGFLDAWGPVFFFAMIFAISMDYTVFLLSAAKEHWDHTHDPHQAMVGGLAHSGRVIFAAGAVMVAVFFTFALSGPLPPKEMGVILGVAVLLDAALIRLLLLPVLLRLMGRSAWYLPNWARRVLPNVTFGHS